MGSERFTEKRILICLLRLYEAEQSRICASNGATANMVGSSPESSREWVKKVQLVLTSHSTHIAPEGGAAFIKPVRTHACTKQLAHIHMHAFAHKHMHTHAHTNTQEGGAQTGWAAFTSQCRASLTFSPLSYALLSFEKGAQRPCTFACIGRLTKQCKEYSENDCYDAKMYNAERKSALLDCWV